MMHPTPKMGFSNGVISRFVTDRFDLGWLQWSLLRYT
jgi:regulator of cell morphogenesis and NO signaling